MSSTSHPVSRIQVTPKPPSTHLEFTPIQIITPHLVSRIHFYCMSIRFSNSFQLNTKQLATYHISNSYQNNAFHFLTLHYSDSLQISPNLANLTSRILYYASRIVKLYFPYPCALSENIPCTLPYSNIVVNISIFIMPSLKTFRPKLKEASSI
jgi:hypothetical protein